MNLQNAAMNYTRDDMVGKLSASEMFPWLAEDLNVFLKDMDTHRIFERKIENSGTIQYYNVQMSRTIDASEHQRGMILVLEDITREKQISEELLQEKEPAEAANRAKSIFLANMSHELRTPLNAILGFSSLMRKDSKSSPEQTENLNVISGSGEHLLSLINNILDISKIEAGHLVCENMDITPELFLQDIKSLMSVTIEKKGLDFNLNVSANLHGQIRVDAVKLRQVLISLIANAIKYTTRGSVSLYADFQYLTTPRTGQLSFAVRDTGIGIRKRDQEIIFLPFRQILDSGAVETGTGLGLTICRQYVARYGGNAGNEKRVWQRLGL